MRIKDVRTVGHVLGRDLRFAAPEEVAGLESAVGALEAWLRYAQADHNGASQHVDAFRAAIAEGKDGHAFAAASWVDARRDDAAT